MSSISKHVLYTDQGYRFEVDGQQFGLWPDDIGRALLQSIKGTKRVAYAVHLATGRVLRME